MNTAGVKEVTRSFAGGGDALWHRTQQLNEPSHVVFVPRAILSRPRIEQEVAGRQLERLEQHPQLKRWKSFQF